MSLWKASVKSYSVGGLRIVVEVTEWCHAVVVRNAHWASDRIVLRRCICHYGWIGLVCLRTCASHTKSHTSAWTSCTVSVTVSRHPPLRLAGVDSSARSVCLKDPLLGPLCNRGLVVHQIVGVVR